MLDQVFQKANEHDANNEPSAALDCLEWLIRHQASTLDTKPYGWQTYHKAYELCMKLGHVKKALFYFNRRLELNFEVDIANQFALLCTEHQHYFLGGKWFNIILKYESDNVASLSNHGKYSMAILAQDKAHEMMTKAYHIVKPCRPFLKEDFINGFSSVYLCNTMYNPKYSSADILSIMKDWHAEFEKNYYDHQAQQLRVFKARPRHAKLRIGYISSDFRKHPMGLFVHGILKEHSRTLFDVYCYNNMHEDAFTAKLKTAHPFIQWLDVSKFTDEDIYHQIMKDEIDVLVDMMGLTNGIRLKTLYLKPAPLILSYIAFPCTIGARCIDYKIADSVAIPPEHDAQYGERILRLDDGFLTFTPSFDYVTPHKIERSVVLDDVVHLSCYNNVQKYSAELLDVFASVLMRVPNAVLHLRYYHYLDPNIADFYYRQFEARGVSRDRLDIGFDKDQTLLQLYENIDIAIDTFPFNGETVTMEALWTGTPVITVLGDSYMSRAGASILTHLGRPEWIARSVEEYVAKIAALAADRERLSAIHRQLHQEFLNSPLGDARRFIASYEKGIIDAWTKWTKCM